MKPIPARFFRLSLNSALAIGGQPKCSLAKLRMLGLIWLSVGWVLSMVFAQAADTDGTWLGDGADGNWTTTANWVGGTVPGAAGVDSGTALFNTSTNADRTIVLTAIRNIGELKFDTASVGAFTIGTTEGSAFQIYPIAGIAAPTYSIQMTSSVTNAQTINAPITFRRFGGTSSGGNQTIINNAVSSAATLTLGGPISMLTADSASTGRTLILSGTNTGANTVSGVIEEGAGNYLVGLQKTGTGTWVLTGANTYSSITTLTGGILSVSNLGNGGVASSIGDSSSAAGNLVFDGGTLRYTGANTTSNRAFTIVAAKTATIETANDLSFAGATGTANSGALTKTGAGVLTLTGVNTYLGSTLVSGGTLLISGTGTVNSTSAVTVSTGGTFRYDSSVGLNRNVTLNGGRFANNSVSNYTGTLTFTSGTLGGSNFSGNALTIGTNQTLAPGNSTGTLSAGATTWANGGTLQFEINDATGTAGSTTAGWDLFTPTTLDITAGVGQFTIQIVSLDNLQSSGLAQNFIETQNYQWTIVDAGSAITGFNANQFVLNTTAFQNAFSGNFSISVGAGLDTDKLFLNYTASVIPEPSTTLLLAGALTALVIFRRRRM